MSPRQIHSFSVETAFGSVAVTASPQGLLSLVLTTSRSIKTTQEPPPEFAGVVEGLKSYFDGGKVLFDGIKLDLSVATPFQTRVWESVRLVTYGETRSYRWVAGKIGQPGAVRAVGQALGKNPLPIIVPCHRIIASDGRVGGYSGGLAMKRRLLRLEGVRVSTAGPSQ